MTRRLLIRPGAIGDFIVSLPAMEALASRFTEISRSTEIWCAEQNVPLARFADRARSIGSVGLDRLGIAHDDDVVERLLAFDEIISWYGENRPDFREYVSRMALPFQFLRALPDGKHHAVDFYAGQARQLGADPAGVTAGVTARVPAGVPRIACPAALRTFAAIHPFASSQAKRAPLEIFQAAAEKLAKEMPVVWFRGPEENLPGALHIPDLYDLSCHLRGARIFVGNDSGISHLAAAVGTPVMAFFQASDPKVWAPRGSAVDVIRAC